MELSLLAAKQKRIKDWNDFVDQGGVQEAPMKAVVLDLLNQFKALLTKCWEAQTVSSDDERTMSTLERKLEQLNEESRMRVVGTKSGLPSRVI